MKTSLRSMHGDEFLPRSHHCFGLSSVLRCLGEVKERSQKAEHVFTSTVHFTRKFRIRLMNSPCRLMGEFVTSHKQAETVEGYGMV
jgi:hypothetical protein